MQKTHCLFFATILICLTLFVQAQTDPQVIDYKLRTGDILTYEVLQGSKKQVLKIKLTGVPDADFSFDKLTFDWNRTGDNDNQSGKVQFAGNHLDEYNLSVTSSFRIDFENIQHNKIFPSQALWLGVKAQIQLALGGTEFRITLLDDKEETKYKLEKKVYYPGATYNGKPCHIVSGKYKPVNNESNYMMVQEGDANPMLMAVYLKERSFFLKLVSIEAAKIDPVAAKPEPVVTKPTAAPSTPTPDQVVKSTPKTAAAKPDSDGDGISDDLDQCKTEREDVDGFEDADGCPDNDNDQDGIADMYDNCPNTKGTAAKNGCP